MFCNARPCTNSSVPTCGLHRTAVFAGSCLKDTRVCVVFSHLSPPFQPANSEAAKLFAENRPEYDRRVKACVEASWL